MRTYYKKTINLLMKQTILKLMEKNKKNNLIKQMKKVKYF